MIAREAVTRALRAIEVLAHDEAAEAPMLVVGLETLNEMLAGWQQWGTYVHAPLERASQMTTPDFLDRAVVNMLARDLTTTFGRPVPMVVAEAADAGDRAVWAHYQPDATMTHEMRRMPSQHRGRFY